MKVRESLKRKETIGEFGEDGRSTRTIDWNGLIVVSHLVTSVMHAPPGVVVFVVPVRTCLYSGDKYDI